MKLHTWRAAYLLGFCVVLFGFFGYFLNKYCTHLHTLPSESSYIFQVDRSTSARSFVHFLKARHLIHSETWFLAWLRFRGLSTQLQAGFYQIQPGESAEHLLQRVVHGDVLKERFQIIEGTNWSQIQTNLSKAPYLNFQKEDLTGVNANALCSLSCIHDNNSIEGLLLADTYQYEAGRPVKAMLLLAHQHLNTYVLQAWKRREATLPYRTPYELLIAASILEKESASSTERRLISGIILNRLTKNMPLQMDPTVIYGLGNRYSGTLSHHDLQDDSPYNTYRRRGLPPTPITMVGRDAIDAAAHPTKTNYLYFVAKGDGTHIFSETYGAQREAIRHYMRKN